MASLKGAKLKLAWANRHLDALESQLREFRKSNPCSVGFHVDYHAGKKFWHVEGPPRQPSSDFSLIAGDILYGFRGCLDYIAWQLVLANNCSPGRHTQFPIFDDSKKFASRGRDMMRGMSKATKAELKGLQPCFTQHPFRKKWLLSLEELGNIDKHRYIQVVLAGTMGGFWIPGLPVHSDGEWFIHEGPIEAGTELAHVDLKHMHVNFAPVLDVAFGEPGPAFGEGVQMLLIGIREYVNLILNTFDYGGFGFTK